MAAKAHRRLLETDWRAARARWEAVEPRFEELAEASYREQVLPALGAVARIGNAYTASLYLALADLLEAEGRVLGGRRLGLFSYGSGCCAEFFTGVVPPQVGRASDSGVAAALATRTFVGVDEYERMLRAGESGGEPPAGFAGEFVFTGVRGDRRVYARPRALAA